MRKRFWPRPRKATPQARAQVVRDTASGLLLRVDSFYANASSLETDGLDVRVRASSTLGGGGR